MRQNNYQFLNFIIKKHVKRKGEEIFVNRGYEQLIKNYYPNRFQDLEYKFTNEEIREVTDESFLYQTVAYVAVLKMVREAK